ncbi:MAG: bifunctional protein FolD [Pseudomonadota bacterium]|jgi:methylenetetrahydrofolate dehydrogenase (NADP+)/methenyltetrahydrofolate cyclohydrolase
MSARIIDGKEFAARLRARVAATTAELKSAHGITPGLAVVLVGEDPASAVYVKSKSKAAHEAGLRAYDIRHPATLSQEALLAQIRDLNADASVHGILVQMPLPSQIDPQAIIAAIDPLKDVDGFHPLNAGRLMSGEYGVSHGLVACTPLGCMMLLKDVLGDLTGKDAVVIGRSNIVGKPIAQLLLQESCTVTIAHSRTRDLAALCARADILVAAVGRAEMVRGSWIKPGATIIDVGINRIEVDGKNKLVGDVAYAEAAEIAGAITPVPGGVGPMTIACLLRNTVVAAALQAGLNPPAI